MGRGTKSKLTLISAPAGFGKTTLLAEWLANSASGRAVAWLSLDQTDNDLATFWSHLVAALQAATGAAGAAFTDLLPVGPKPDEAFLAKLLNVLGDVSGDLDLVLDDFHVIDQRSIEEGLSFLLEHLPSNIHLVMSTRADPALALGRLRARGELIEIRSGDLRFIPEEVTAYINGSMRLGLTAQDITVLGGRTEGWIAALQLAVLSLEGRNDATAFIEGFAGSDRYIVDYLVEEVLQRVPDEIRHFLFCSCFLERLSGSLCDAVIGSSGGKAMLDALDRQNLFIVPLDDRRQWYRYHHLFADVLRAHLPDEVRNELPTLHRRAADWYEEQGDRPEAISQVLAGGDFERAAELMEMAIPDVQKARGEAIIRNWMRALPTELVRARPVLGMGFVGALAALGELGEVEGRLGDIERGLAAFSGGDARSSLAHRVVVIDTTQLPRMPGAMELYRTALAQVRGDIPRMIYHAERVLALAQPDDHVSRAAGSSLLGIAYWSAGNLEQARRLWSDGRDGLEHATHIADVLGVSVALADISIAQGHLVEAKQVYDHALELAAAQGVQVLRGTADMYAGLAALSLQQGELQIAHQHLQKCHELGEVAGLPQHPYRWRVAAAHLRQSEGNLEGAVALLDEAVRLYVGDFFPNVRPVAATRARVWIAQGRLGDATRWQRETGVGIDDELSYLREFEHITLARLLIAKNETGGVSSAFLARLLDQATSGDRVGSIIELSVLQALALRTSDAAGSFLALEKALSLAEPEGYVRLFAEEGEPMAALLRLAVKRRIVPTYAQRLLAAVGQPRGRPQVHPDLIEPLSERELDVLRLLRSDLGGPEIARELSVSENTMRTHTKNIYEKLGVNNRRSAVRRAEELNLLGRNSPH
ncbi:MAG: LuxR C-terminal-related transcriptional regulator [Devosia sp.]